MHPTILFARFQAALLLPLLLCSPRDLNNSNDTQTYLIHRQRSVLILAHLLISELVNEFELEVVQPALSTIVHLKAPEADQLHSITNNRALS